MSRFCSESCGGRSHDRSLARGGSPPDPPLSVSQSPTTVLRWSGGVSAAPTTGLFLLQRLAQLTPALVAGASLSRIP